MVCNSTSLLLLDYLFFSFSEDNGVPHFVLGCCSNFYDSSGSSPHQVHMALNTLWYLSLLRLTYKNFVNIYKQWPPYPPFFSPWILGQLLNVSTNYHPNRGTNRATKGAKHTVTQNSYCQQDWCNKHLNMKKITLQLEGSTCFEMGCIEL